MEGRAVDIKAEYFSNSVTSMDFFAAAVGELIGTGTMRTVYRWEFNRDFVIKFEHGSKCFANVTERDIWVNAKHECKPLMKWLAPVYDISPCGIILWQKFIPDIPVDKLPKRVPECFADLKRENWGIWRGQPVCRDYGNHAAWRTGLSMKMRKADWR